MVKRFMSRPIGWATLAFLVAGLLPVTISPNGKIQASSLFDSLTETLLAIRMVSRNLLAWLLLALVPACDPPAEQSQALHAGTAPRTDSIAPSVTVRVIYESTEFQAPVSLAAADSFLVVLTPYSRPAVRVLDTRSTTIVGVIDGPSRGSFLRSVVVAGDTAWVADANRREIVGIPVAELTQAPRWEELPSVEVPHPFSSLAAVTSSGFFLVSPLGGGAHFVLDRAGTIVSSFLGPRLADDLPEIGIRPYMEYIGVDTVHNVYVAAGRWWDGVIAYGRDGTIHRRLRANPAFLPEFEVSNRRGEAAVIPGRLARVAYLGLVVNSGMAFALYSGAYHYGAGESAFVGTELHSYDVETSERRSVMKIGQPVRYIAAAEGDGVLYGLTWGEPASILELVLPREEG